MTLPEIVLWRELRKRPSGFKFRRQHPAGRYVLDFYCVAASLCVEVDGMAHDMGENPARDAARDAWLLQQEVRTFRIGARDVLQNLDGVVMAIVKAASAR